MSRVAVRRNCTTGVHEAQHLLDRAGQERAVGAQRRELVGVREQRQHAARDEVARRVAAGVDEQQEEQVELEVGEPLAVDLGGEQHARRCRRRAAPRFARAHAGRVARASPPPPPGVSAGSPALCMRSVSS